jgi:hypothetical protein
VFAISRTNANLLQAVIGLLTMTMGALTILKGWS